MNYGEEQSNEIEAIESIYGPDFTIISKSPPAYQLNVTPTSDGSEQVHVGVILVVGYPPNYPDEAPRIRVQLKMGLSGPQLSDCQTLVDKTISENPGMVCVFTVAEAVKEWLAARNEPERSMHELAASTKVKVEDEDSKDDEDTIAKLAGSGHHEEEFHYVSPIPAGTLVTRESFADWHAKFEKERQEAERLKSGVDVDAKSKMLTGRQLFERNEGLGLEETEEEKQAEVFWFNEDAYADDEDIPDVDEEDDGAAGAGAGAGGAAEEEEDEAEIRRQWKEQMMKDAEADDADDEPDTHETKKPSAAKSTSSHAAPAPSPSPPPAAAPAKKEEKGKSDKDKSKDGKKDSKEKEKDSKGKKDKDKKGGDDDKGKAKGGKTKEKPAAFKKIK